MILSYAHHTFTSNSLKFQLKSELQVEYFNIHIHDYIECYLEIGKYGYHFNDGIDKIYCDQFIISFILTPTAQNYLKEDNISIFHNLSTDKLINLKNDLRELLPLKVE